MTQDNGQPWGQPQDEPARQRSGQQPYPPYTQAPQYGPYGQQPQYAPYQPPQRPKKHRGRNITLGIIGSVVFVIIVASITDSIASPKTPSAAVAVTQQPAANNPAAPAVAPATTPAAGGAAQVTYKCTGSAPDGVDITYGPEGSDYSASRLPFSKTMPLTGSPQFVNVTAQLSGSGHVSCTTTVQASDGTKTVNSAAASGGYNLASAEVCSDFTGGWDAC